LARQSRELRVGVRKQPAREQWIVCEVDAWHNVARMKCDLFRLREKVIGIPVERHLPDFAHRHHFLGDELRRIE
jgi:hypothetical protein